MRSLTFTSLQMLDDLLFQASPDFSIFYTLIDHSTHPFLSSPSPKFFQLVCRSSKWRFSRPCPTLPLSSIWQHCHSHHETFPSLPLLLFSWSGFPPTDWSIQLHQRTSPLTQLQCSCLRGSALIFPTSPLLLESCSHQHLWIQNLEIILRILHWKIISLDLPPEFLSLFFFNI